jgi:hypothetical protein
LRRRAAAIDADSEHLARALPPASVHNRILRLRDIAGYIGLDSGQLRKLLMHQSANWSMPPKVQENLSRFFWGWDSGQLVKACLMERWQIVPRHTALEEMASSPGPSASFDLRLEHTAHGPRLRGR